MKQQNRKLIAARKERFLTQEALAEQLKTTKVSIFRWEAGDNPSLYFRESLVKFFEKSARDLGLDSEELSSQPVGAIAEEPPLQVERKITNEPRFQKNGKQKVFLKRTIIALMALVVVIASSLAGWTILQSYIESKSLTRVDWNNFIYPGLCNPNQGEHVTVQNGTAIDSGSLGRFFVQVYAPTTFGDLTGDGQPEAIVPYGCSDTNLKSPMKGTVYVHALIFSGYAVQPVVLGQFPALSGQLNRDFASVDYLYIDHEVLHLIGDGFSGGGSTMFDQQITLTYRWVGNQFQREHSQTDSIASLLPRPGSNGQQLAYACPGMTDMEVLGTGQDKKNATWGPNQATNGGLTWEFWWVGPVRIQWKDQAGKVHTDDHVSVPQQYTTYIYYAACT